MPTSAFWFRRDLRFEDNIGLDHAMRSGHNILAVFIFDTDIIEELPADDARVDFIYNTLNNLNAQMAPHAGLLIRKGRPTEAWQEILDTHSIKDVYLNRDYEPYAIQRDEQLNRLCSERNIGFKSFKDQVMFEANEVTKSDGNPYHVFTPYKNKWLEQLEKRNDFTVTSPVDFSKFVHPRSAFPSRESLGIKPNPLKVHPFKPEAIAGYHKVRDYPAEDGGSYAGPHLRFGTISIRNLAQLAAKQNETFLNELIWREFFMQILYHYPEVVNHAFRKKYDNITWQNNHEHFERWCEGRTGYPLVDAGMRQLAQSGAMHNRVRMVAASFLVKHLLIDWRWGEAWFAKKLLDFELSSNNGNWQWVAGTGCDAAPYFRVFNPVTQQKKFDPDFRYIKKWVPEFGTPAYPAPMVEHAFARERAVAAYREVKAF